MSVVIASRVAPGPGSTIVTPKMTMTRGAVSAPSSYVASQGTTTLMVPAGLPANLAAYHPPPSRSSSHVASYVPPTVNLPGVISFTSQSIPGTPHHPLSSVSMPAFKLGSTQGLPDPTSIEEQKQAFNRSLDVQLEEGSNSLIEQNKERKQQLYQAAQQRKAALILQVEQQMKMQEMAMDEQMNQAMMGLKKAALDQRAALEQQAASLTLEYQQRKMAEEFAESQAEMQRQYQESHTKLQSDMQQHLQEAQEKIKLEAQKQLKAALPAGSAAVPAGSALLPTGSAVLPVGTAALPSSAPETPSSVLRMPVTSNVPVPGSMPKTSSVAIPMGTAALNTSGSVAHYMAVRQNQPYPAASGTQGLANLAAPTYGKAEQRVQSPLRVRHDSVTQSPLRVRQSSVPQNTPTRMPL